MLKKKKKRILKAIKYNSFYLIGLFSVLTKITYIECLAQGQVQIKHLNVS